MILIVCVCVCVCSAKTYLRGKLLNDKVRLDQASPHVLRGLKKTHRRYGEGKALFLCLLALRIQ